MASFQEVVAYFVNPLNEPVYTVPKTVVFTITLLVAVYGLFLLLKKMKVKVNIELAVAISPYIVLGGLIRVMQDMHLVNSALFVTPGIYFFIFSIVIITLAVSLFVERKYGIPYFKPMFVVGLVAAAVGLMQINFTNAGGLLTLIFYLPWLIIFYKIKWSPANKTVTLVQMFDATVTYVGTNFFGYPEQHVVPTLLMNIFSPISFLFVKVVAVVLALLIIDRLADKDFAAYLKLIIGILGAAPAARDIIRLLALV